MRSGARYLLRFDDICPGMNWPMWRSVETILKQAGIRPLLAVVPDNRDPKLSVCSPNPSFWNEVREWQQLDWSIGLHGFQHLYTTASAGLLGRNEYSEFAGVPAHEQRLKIECGLKILQDRQIRTDAWIAPAHSFDHTTVRILAELGVDCISDGYSLWPFVCDRGLLWIPQQLGRFYPMPFGTWTVCLHINSWNTAALERFRSAVDRFRTSIVGLADLRRQYSARRRHWGDRVFFTCFRAARSVRGEEQAPSCMSLF